MSSYGPRSTPLNSRRMLIDDRRATKDSEREFRELVAINVSHEKLTVELAMLHLEGPADLNGVVVIAAKNTVACGAQGVRVVDPMLRLMGLVHRSKDVVVGVSHHVARETARNDVSFNQVRARTVKAATQHPEGSRHAAFISYLWGLFAILGRTSRNAP